MICMICKKAFIIERRIIDIFEYQRYFICNKCYKEHPIHIEYNKIPLENNYFLNVISIIDESFKGNFAAYLNEYSYIVEEYYLKKSVILYDVFSLNKYNIDALNKVALLERNDIYVICFKFVIK